MFIGSKPIPSFNRLTGSVPLDEQLDSIYELVSSQQDKQSAYLSECEAAMFDKADNARHDFIYRQHLYAPEDREVFLLLVEDKHMTDEELYTAIRNREE